MGFDWSDRAERRKMLGRILMLEGVAVSAYAAAHVHGLKQGFTLQRKGCEWRPGRGRSVLLRGANVVDVKRGQVLKERGVLFADGQLGEIVSTRDLDKAAADHVFDCSGLYLMPGLINCHVHALMPCAAAFGPDVLMSVKRQAIRNMEECALRGVTTLRDTTSFSGLLGEVSAAIERFEMLGPRVVSCGPSLVAKGGYPDFSMQVPPWLASRWGDLSLYVDSPESGRQGVRKAVEQGARFIKLFFDDRSLFFGNKPLNVIDDESVKAIVDEAHRLGRRVGVHQTQMNGYRRALRLGVDDLEHLPIDGTLTDQDVADFMAGDHHVTPTAAVSMALGMAPPGHPARGNELVEAMQAGREHLMERVAPGMCEEAVQRANRKVTDLYMSGRAKPSGPAARFLFDNELMIEAIVGSAGNVTRIYEAGGRVCCGNDGGTPISFPGYLVAEMQILRYMGLSNADILRSATITAAGLLDMESELGSIEPGKLADLVLLSANPMEDVRALDRVEAVFRAGALLSRGVRFPATPMV
ncbi:MAG: amidohydrolase family protein [Actinobacteria bacterium]|nr:amidohydrolase family protein [Actinomycetota bacterium]MBU1943092.1 amidohydrolase family protein [Actinomycetota bacterium]MBU2687961.1 amidohydrolase family protein [Actinomycetota bacterium]